MSLHKVAPAMSFVHRNVRRLCTKVRLDLIKENVETRNSYNINFVRVGSGPNAILLMPGAIGTIETDFKPQIDGLPKLLDNHTIIAWDPPGYGSSRPPERTFPVGFYHHDAYLAAALMRQLGFEKYSIVGWSDGGTTGLILASYYPQAVKKLAIWGTGPMLLPADVEICQSIRDVSKWSTQRRKELESVYGCEYLPKLWANYVDGIQHLFDVKAGKMSLAEIQRIEAKTLILNGAKDFLIAREHVPFLRRTLRSSEYYEFPDGKHNIHLRYSDEFNRVLSDFMLKDD